MSRRSPRYLAENQRIPNCATQPDAHTRVRNAPPRFVRRVSAQRLRSALSHSTAVTAEGDAAAENAKRDQVTERLRDPRSGRLHR